MAIGLAVLLSLLPQLYSIHLLDTKRRFTEHVNRELAARPEPVIATDIWWAPHELYSTFFEKPIFFVRTPEQLEVLKGRLRDAGYEAFLFVSQDLDQPTIGDRGLGFFALTLTTQRIAVD